jgi:sulfur carrier protein
MSGIARDCTIAPVLTIILNGQKTEIPEGSTVRSLLAARHLAPDKVAIELNRRLLKSDRYDTPLQPNDAIEIVTFVGGG